jgi:hypothetical protein
MRMGHREGEGIQPFQSNNLVSFEVFDREEGRRRQNVGVDFPKSQTINFARMNGRQTGPGSEH